jgi:2-oxo-4-hydroxy-4-carboxy-5-ureidoimidazoline decarboxylase
VTLAEFNALPAAQAESVLMDCCGAARWVAGVASKRPYKSVEALGLAADAIWWDLDRSDWLEAFSHHPQIGEKAASGSASAREWAAGEQSGGQGASGDLKARLARGNRAYFEKFGYIYIVCATGKSAQEMLAILERRLQNDPSQELPVATEQQRLITRIRLEKLFAPEKRSS